MLGGDVNSPEPQPNSGSRRKSQADAAQAPPMLALLLPTLAQDAVPGPSSKSDFARLSASACSQNSSLVHYFFPKRLHGNVHDSW